MGLAEILFALVIAGCPIAIISLVGILFLVVLVWVAKRVQQKSQQANAVLQSSQSWPSTTGTVIKSRVEVRGGSNTTHVDPKIVYEYQVSGQQYQADQIRVDARHRVFQVSPDAYAVVDRYPVGTSVTVYYNPDNPAEAGLER